MSILRPCLRCRTIPRYATPSRTAYKRQQHTQASVETLLDDVRSDDLHERLGRALNSRRPLHVSKRYGQDRIESRDKAGYAASPHAQGRPSQDGLRETGGERRVNRPSRHGPKSPSNGPQEIRSGIGVNQVGDHPLAPPPSGTEETRDGKVMNSSKEYRIYPLSLHRPRKPLAPVMPPAKLPQRPDHEQSKETEVATPPIYQESRLDFSNLERLQIRIDKSLARFRERQNLDLTERLWRNFQAGLKVAKAQKGAEPVLVNCFENFLRTFQVLRRADYTVSVWNTLVATGYSPLTRTWNALLKGCHVGAQVDEMEQLWARMIRSGARPGKTSWQIRINGLFKFRQTAKGFRALAELGHLAKASDLGLDEQSEGRQARPSVSIMNNALSGALSGEREVIGRILAWGKEHSLRPDEVTYNILLKVALQADQRDGARKILQQMKAAGHIPDVHTYAELVKGFLREENMADLSAEEQRDRALSSLAIMADAGEDVTPHIYTLLLDRLLKVHNNVLAAKAVLEHMEKRGLKPSPHMCTVLVTHYFALDPPDIEAVDTLWQRIVNSENYVLDVIFYDRMLEGYAKTGQMGKMMYFLTRMSKEGKRPGWIAMTEVLKCMILKGDRERARELVVDVKQVEGAVRSGVRGRKGYHEFWQLVREQGLYW